MRTDTLRGRRFRRTSSVSLPLVSLGVAALVAAGCGGSGANEPSKKRGGGPIPVETTVVRSGDLVYSVAGTGSLEAYQIVTVASRIDGVIEAVAFSEGDQVTPETELAIVDRTRRLLEKAEAETAVAKAEAAVPRAKATLPRAEAAIAQAAAAVERGKAQVSAARTDLREAEEMLARRMAVRAATSGAVAEEEVTAARTQVERRRDAISVAEAAARETEASLTAAEAVRASSIAEEAEAVAGVSQARAKLALVTKTAADTGVRSPIAGVVRRRHVTPGQYVRAGDAIAEIVDRSRLLVRFRVSEAESARLARDMKVVVRVPALDAIDHPASLVHVDETASATTRMVECLAELEKPAPSLKPGFYALASVDTKTARALAVPESALQPTERGWIAYVVVDGKARARLLTLGLRTNDGRVEVISGLAEGESLVTKGANVLTEGAAVSAGGGPAAKGDGSPAAPPPPPSSASPSAPDPTPAPGSGAK